MNPAKSVMPIADIDGWISADAFFKAYSAREEQEEARLAPFRTLMEEPGTVREHIV